MEVRRVYSKSEAKKTLIIQKARELFIQQGYNATSFSSIVAYAGISKGSIYYHFNNKENLFISVLEYDIEEWKDEWEHKKINYTQFEEYLRGVAHHYLEHFNNPILIVSQEFFMSHPNLSQESKDKVHGILDSPLEIYKEVLEIGKKDHIIQQQSIDDLAVIFNLTIGGMTVGYRKYEEEEFLKLFDTFINIFLKGI